MSTALERFPLLAALSEGQRRVLCERIEWLDVEDGATLFREGDPADAMLLVLEGRVRVSSAKREAHGDLGPGSTIGALSLVVEGPREATARALSPSRVLRLSRSGFENLRSAAPETACRLLEGIVRESALFTRDALAHLARSARA